MITEQAETIMMQMHERLITKERKPELLTLMNHYWEVEQKLTRKFKCANSVEDKDKIMMELIEAFVKKAKELNTDDTTMMMAYIGVIRT